MVKEAWRGMTPRRRAVAATLLVVSLAHFGLGSWRAAARGFVDLHIFLQRTYEFSLTGELYPNADNEKAYAAAAPVYKAPPLFAVLLLPQVRGGIPADIYAYHWIAHILLYLATVLLLLKTLGPGRGPWLSIWLAVLALNFVPFFETLWRLQLETPILFLVVLALWLDGKGRKYLAGAAIGVAVMLKIYPVFLLGWFVVRRCARGLVGAFVTMAALGLLGWWVVGAEQNLAYFTVILPRMLQESAMIDPENVSLAKPFQTLLGLAPPLAKRATQMVALAVLSGGYWILYRRGDDRRRSLDPTLLLALFVCAMLMFMPNAWTNYLMLLLVPFAVVLSRMAHDVPSNTGAAGSALFAFFLTLFYTPCGSFREGIPCTEDPPFLGVLRWPRGVHDLMVEWKVIAVAALVAAWFAVARKPDA
jgi:hypothetical protein